MCFESSFQKQGNLEESQIEKKNNWTQKVKQKTLNVILAVEHGINISRFYYVLIYIPWFYNHDGYGM